MRPEQVRQWAREVGIGTIAAEHRPNLEMLMALCQKATMDSYDHRGDHLLRSYIRGNGYVTLYWPRNATLRELECIRAIVNLQLDMFIADARKETEVEEAARLEYESWKAQP